ncbi:MAG: flagellar basal body rod protein FlgC [Deltaproteobacteria bacterium]|nr:flagellar basal body rod protein FlgC [Deltaproteobacteria bacterium]MBW2106718.1 flagellar basal body rod protein FlgC [Deltaproteobacteria bacterium]
MNFLQSLEISASGLYAQRRRMDVIASNLANIETTHTKKGGPYRRKMVVMSPKPVEDFNKALTLQAEGVKIDDIVEDKSPFRKAYNPSHPDADKNGYVLKPNVDLIVEITNMLMARRAFEANISAIKSTKQMALKALEIGR